MNNELVSIVMATYNGEKYIHQQLDSICNQTYTNIELIVVDDGSIDGTLSILDKYMKLDSRIHVFPSVYNFGVVSNFERGIKLAKGNYIAFSDQDDIFRTDKIEILLSTLKRHSKRDLVISDLSLIDGKGENIASSMWHYSSLKPKVGKPFRRLVYRNFATGCAMMINRRLLDIALPFPSDCNLHDWWLAVAASSSEAGGICLVDKQLTYYRLHGANVCGIEEAGTLNMGVIILRLKARYRGYENFEKRLNKYRQDIKRLNGYLQSHVWSEKEQIYLQKTIQMLNGYKDDIHLNLIKRLSKLPQRLVYARIVGGLPFCLAVTMHTVLPYK